MRLKILFILVLALICSNFLAVDLASAKANRFNPWLHKTLPNPQNEDARSKNLLAEMGARQQSIENEARHRPRWREELYPVVFGNVKSQYEIIALLDFANPQSEVVWYHLVAASKALDPQKVKIVLFCRNQEQYGTELTGFAIWLSYAKPQDTLPFLNYAFEEWNHIRKTLLAKGQHRPFRNAFDARIGEADYPIHHRWIIKFKPRLDADTELNVLKYCYDAGNVNMFQAAQVAKFYKVESIPAIIIDGQVLKQQNSQAILNALQMLGYR